MGKIIVIVDFGHFRAYKVTREPLESPSIELIESYDHIDAHGRLGEKLTDKAGKFSRAGTTGAGGSGEPHNMELEKKRRLIKLITQDIKTLINRENCKKWSLAANKNINNQILKNLDSDLKSKLYENIVADLTKVDKSEVLRRFEE